MKETVGVYIPHYSRPGSLYLSFDLILDDDDKLLHVKFHPRLSLVLDRLGYPKADWVDGYIEGLVHRSFKVPRG